MPLWERPARWKPDEPDRRSPPLCWPPASSTRPPRPPSVSVLLLALGAPLVFVALILWLWGNEFLTPPVIAIGLAIVNAVVLAVGWCMLYTRYRWLGRAITLLACLVMPLHVAYHHGNDLVVRDGLWVAGLLILLLYAASGFLAVVDAPIFESVVIDEKGITHYRGFRDVSRLEWHNVKEVSVEWPDLVCSSQPMAPLPEVTITAETGQLTINSAPCYGLPALLVGLAALPGFPIEDFCNALNRRDTLEEVVFWRRSAGEPAAAPDRGGIT